MRVSPDNAKLVRHKVIEYTDREKFHRQRKSKRISSLPVSGI